MIKDHIINYRAQYADIDFIKNNLHMFLEVENAVEKEKVILNMFEKNNDILKSNFDILDNKFFNILGEDKINQIACYPDVTDSVLKLNNNQLKLLKMNLDFYIDKIQGENWTEVASRILKNIDSYQELAEEIENRDNVDVEKVNSIVIHHNKFGIKTIDDVTNYEKIKQEKCEKLINSSNVSDKIEGVLQKIFNISREEAESEVNKFAQDIDLIKDEELKIYIKSIENVINLSEPSLLQKIFKDVQSVENNNILFMERMLKNEYGKMYNEGLFNIENAEKIEGQPNMYNAGTDFKMIITSVAPYVYNQPENYYKDWNRPSIGSQHFCASYIRNDMMGHASIPHICYGFNQMSNDALLLSGNYDIASTGSSFVSTAGRKEKYYSPDKQIDETFSYNEMDFRRIQNGEKKQPDYIVVFRKDEKIDNIDKAQKASQEFGNLPIVVIDVDKCLEAERQKVNELQRQYQETKNPEVAQELYQKIRNNRVTDKKFCEEIDLEQIRKETQVKEKVNDKDLKEIYSEVSAEERKEESGKIHSIYREINSILEKGENDGRQ